MGLFFVVSCKGSVPSTRYVCYWAGTATLPKLPSCMKTTTSPQNAYRPASLAIISHMKLCFTNSFKAKARILSNLYSRVQHWPHFNFTVHHTKYFPTIKIWLGRKCAMGCWHHGKFGKYVDRMDLLKHFQTLSLSFYRTFLAIPPKQFCKKQENP